VLGNEQEPQEAVLFDPFLGKKPAPPKKPPFSPAAVTGALLSLLPIGSITAIFFGVAGLRQTRLGTMRGRGLALSAVGLGGLLTVGYAVGTTVLVMRELETQHAKVTREDERWAAKQRERESEERAKREAEAEALKTATPLKAPALPSPQGTVPQTTQTRTIGNIPVVEMGVAEPSLSAAILREVETAKKENREVMLMLGRAGCGPCDGVMVSLTDPLMQDALSTTRLVRVDIEVFGDDLKRLNYPTARMPGFFLVRSDAMPRDGIDGGEWGDDIAQNIAPVLKPFSRGVFKRRKREWKPLPMSGTFL
jgi:hypothetical protein